MISKPALHWILVILFALLLSILPLPSLLLLLRPPFILLLMIYLQCFMPQYFSSWLLLLLGLSLDSLHAGVLGQHVLALSLIALLLSRKARRIPFFPMSQQMILVMLLVLTYQLILFFTDAFLGYQSSLLAPVASACTASALWPWLKSLADSGLRLSYVK